MKNKRKTKRELLDEVAALRREVAALRIEQEPSELSRKFLTLQYAGAAIASSLDLDYILNAVTHEMANLLQVEACTIFEWDAVNRTTVVIATYHRDQGALPKAVNQVYNVRDFYPAQKTLMERQVQALVAGDVSVDSKAWEYLQNNQAKTLLILPMEFRDHVVGMVEFHDSQHEIYFDPQEIALAQMLANQAASAIRNARLYEQIRRELVERVELEHKLRQAVTRNQAVLDAIPDTLVYLDHQGQILDCKLAGEDPLILGIMDQINPSPDQAGEMGLPAPLIARIRTYLPQVFATGKMQVFDYQQTSLLGTQDFEVRLVVTDPGEALAIIRNITSQKQAERQALRTERLTALGRLTAALAHEISNPLQAIQGYLDLILDFPLEIGEPEKYLQIIRQEIQRLAEITENTLGYAQPRLLPRQLVQVDQVVLRVLDLTRKQLAKSNLKVTTDFRESPPVMAVPNQLTQIFFNLVMNANEAVSNPGHLHIAVYPENKEVAISFTNDGPTIPADVLSRIFEPFFTTKPEGSGMGLWISHNIVEQLSGSLTVENLGRSQGVSFTVKLPAALDSDKF